MTIEDLVFIVAIISTIISIGLIIRGIILDDCGKGF